MGGGNDRRPSEQDIAAHYDDLSRARSIARLYEASTPAGERYRDRMARVAKHLEGLDGSLLDVGCGTGQMIRFLRRTCPGQFVITGIDPSLPMLRVAGELVGADADVRLEIGRIERVPFPDSTFAVVLVMGSLEYANDVDGSLAEVARVTGPGGRVIVTMMNRHSPYRIWDAAVAARLRKRRGGVESPVRHVVSERPLCTALKASGLSPVEIEYFDFNVVPAPLDARFPRIATFVERRLRPLADTKLRRLANDFLIVANRIGAAPTSESSISDVRAHDRQTAPTSRHVRVA